MIFGCGDYNGVNLKTHVLNNFFSGEIQVFSIATHGKFSFTIALILIAEFLKISLLAKRLHGWHISPARTRRVCELLALSYSIHERVAFQLIWESEGIKFVCVSSKRIATSKYAMCALCWKRAS
jgi:hypothetical protein